MDASAPNKRPSPKQAAWCRRDNANKHRLDQKRRAEGKPSDPKRVRLAAVRLKELQRIFRDSFGVTLPDGDVGSLELLVGYAIWARKNPQHQISTWASWCDASEIERIIWSATTHPVWHEPDELGREIGLTYAVRKRLAVRTIRGIDASSEGEMERLRCDNRNANKRLKRVKARKESTTMQTESAPQGHHLSRRQQAVLEIIDGETAAPQLVEQLRRHTAFRGVAAASLRVVVHRTLDQLLAVDLIAEHYATGQKGPVRHVARHQR